MARFDDCRRFVVALVSALLWLAAFTACASRPDAPPTAEEQAAARAAAESVSDVRKPRSWNADAEESETNADLDPNHPLRIFNRGNFKRRREPTVEPDTQLLRILLIQVLPDPKKADVRKDLGYLREERLVVKIKPWEQRSASGFNLHTPGSFKFAAKEPDGSIVVYEAVDRKFWYVLNLEGRPIGQIDEHGVVRRFDGHTGTLTEVGVGDLKRAVELLFDLRAFVPQDPLLNDAIRLSADSSKPRSAEQLKRYVNAFDTIVATKPEVVFTVLDLQKATERKTRTAQPLGPEFEPDPLYHDEDRIWNK